MVAKRSEVGGCSALPVSLAAAALLTVRVWRVVFLVLGLIDVLLVRGVETYRELRR